MKKKPHIRPIEESTITKAHFGKCKICGTGIREHEWFGTMQDGHVVCPVEWIEKNEIKLYEATIYDCALFWTLYNDDDARKFYFNPKKVSWDEHVEWFRKKLNDSECELYIIKCGSEPVGEIRLEHSKHGTDVGIGIDRKHWNKGYATAALKLVTSQLPLIARIHRLNKASLRAFEKAGFKYKCDLYQR